MIDPGTARISRYSYRTKVQRLPIEPISQASANQRKGRCGRVEEGICIRLYSEEDFESRPEFTDPEILRTNLASVILQMTALGLATFKRFHLWKRRINATSKTVFACWKSLERLTPKRRTRKTLNQHWSPIGSLAYRPASRTYGFGSAKIWCTKRSDDHRSGIVDSRPARASFRQTTIVR